MSVALNAANMSQPIHWVHYQQDTLESSRVRIHHDVTLHEGISSQNTVHCFPAVLQATRDSSAGRAEDCSW